MVALTPLALVERTFLFTDLERSTRLWEEQPEVMKDAVLAHFALIEAAVDGAGGHVFNHTGDGLVAAFVEPQAALDAAAVAQRSIAAAPATPLGSLHSRMGIHTGDCYEYVDRFSGRALNRCARLNAVGHARQVLVSGTTAAAVESESLGQLRLHYLGEFELRDLSQPERVYQLVGEGLQAEFPDLRTRGTLTSRLPRELDTFVGRVADVTALTRLLRATDSSVVTLTGEAGVGKTRLARRAAAACAPGFRDGAHWLDVASSPGQRLVAELAGMLGSPMPADVASAVRELASAVATQQLLLVLDNCESDLDAVRGLVGALIDRGPDVRVLATSRIPLDLPGERVHLVDPLPVEPDRGRALSAAGELFVDRASSLPEARELSADERRTVGDICAALGGLPLAIEQAAASLEFQSLRQLLDAVQSEDLANAAGFERVMASIDRTAGLLTADEARLLGDLSVFRGAFTVDDVVDVCLEGELSVVQAHGLLRGLRRLSFVHPSGSIDGSGFRLLEPVRAFALTRSAVTQSSRARHETRVLDLARTAADGYRTGDQRPHVEALRASWSDIRVVVRSKLDRGETTAVLELVESLHEYCLFALLPDVYTWADELAQLDEMDANPLVTGIRALGAWVRGDLDVATALAKRSLAVDSESEAARYAHRALMNTYSYRSSMADAAPHYLALVQINLESPAAFWNVDGLASQAIGLNQIGHDEDAVEAAKAAVDLAERTRNQACLSWAYYSLGVSVASSSPMHARSALERSVYEADVVGSTWNSNNGRLELLLLRRRFSDAASGDFTFDVEGAQIAWELLGRFERARAMTQLWQVAMETAWMLAESGRLDDAAALYAPVVGRPRMPRPDAPALDRQVADLLGGRDANPYLADEQVLGLCRSGLELLLGTG